MSYVSLDDLGLPEISDPSFWALQSDLDLRLRMFQGLRRPLHRAHHEARVVPKLGRDVVHGACGTGHQMMGLEGENHQDMGKSREKKTIQLVH